jgi:hypothetical protein
VWILVPFLEIPFLRAFETALAFPVYVFVIRFLISEAEKR